MCSCEVSQRETARDGLGNQQANCLPALSEAPTAGSQRLNGCGLRLFREARLKIQSTPPREWVTARSGRVPRLTLGGNAGGDAVGTKELACGSQAFIATLLFDPSMSALPIIAKQNSPSVGLFTHR